MHIALRTFAIAAFALSAVTTLFAQSAAEKYFTNTELIDQNGRSVRFYQDVMKDKVVVIDSFHTACKSTVPVMNSNFKRLQEAFPADLGKRLLFISVTVDPVTDTSAVVSKYAKQQQARDGWLFLTGTKENVSFMLNKLGLYVDNPEDHLTIFLIGNDTTSLWKKAFGLAKPDDLIAVVKSVLDDKKPD
jgi:protein SCO1/2